MLVTLCCWVWLSVSRCLLLNVLTPMWEFGRSGRWLCWLILCSVRGGRRCRTLLWNVVKSGRCWLSWCGCCGLVVGVRLICLGRVVRVLLILLFSVSWRCGRLWLSLRVWAAWRGICLCALRLSVRCRCLRSIWGLCGLLMLGSLCLGDFGP